MRLLLTNHCSEQPRVFPFQKGQVGFFTQKASFKEGPNEDALAILTMHDQFGVVAVADGVGGAPQGDIAAKIAIEALACSPKSAPTDFSDIRNFVIQAIENANTAILQLGVGAATTLAAAAVGGTTIQTFHAGDSPIFLMGQRGRIRLASIPHSPTGYADAAGIAMDEDDPEWFVQNRSLVSNFLGSRDMRIEIGPRLEMNKKDTLLIASDGLSDNLSQTQIIEIARKGTLEEVTNTLANTCLSHMHSGDEPICHIDDLSFVVYRPE